MTVLHRRWRVLQVRKRALLHEELREEVIPIGVVPLDQIDLSLTRIFLEALLAMDRSLDAVVPFDPHEPLHRTAS